MKTKINLKTLNNPEEIIKTLTKTPEHLGVIYKIIKADEKAFMEYFDGSMYIDEDLEKYPFLAFLSSQVFKWCACAVGHDGRLEALYELMKMIDDKQQDKISYEEYKQKIQAMGGDNVFCILMDFFGDFSLFSHGGSCYGSWLDYDGALVYAHLKNFMKDKEVQAEIDQLPDRN